LNRISPAASGKEHFIGLEWLRFLLGLYVVIYHTLHNYTGEEHLAWLRSLAGLGFFATSSFFVLSGFLLAHVYCRDGVLREPAPSFWSKRFANLYPLHIFSLLLTALVIFCIANLGIPPDDTKASLRFVIYDTNAESLLNDRDSLEHWMSNGEMALNVVLQLLMLQAWNPYYLTFNAPLWSLSTLFFFYLAFPLLAPRLVAVKHKWCWLAALMALYLVPPLVVIANGLYDMPWTGILHRLPILRLPEFLAGVTLYGLFRRRRDSGREPTALGRVLMALGIVACFLLACRLVAGEKYWYYLLHNGLLLPSQLALIYLAALPSKPQRQDIERWARRLGAASLPLFALHVPLFVLFSRLEKLSATLLEGCSSGWSACIAVAGEQPLSLWLYPLFLVVLCAFCVWTQEHAVVPLRKRLLRHLPTRTSS